MQAGQSSLDEAAMVRLAWTGRDGRSGDEGARCSVQCQVFLMAAALVMKLQSGLRWHALSQSGTAHLKRDTPFLMVPWQVSHGGLLSDFLGGPGLGSIPALRRRIRREWAGFVPPVAKNTLLVGII